MEAAQHHFTPSPFCAGACMGPIRNPPRGSYSSLLTVRLEEDF